MAAMLIIIAKTFKIHVYINSLMFKNYIQFMPETHINFRPSCVVHSRHLLILNGTAKLKSLTLTNNLTLKFTHYLRKNP